MVFSGLFKKLTGEKTEEVAAVIDDQVTDAKKETKLVKDDTSENEELNESFEVLPAVSVKEFAVKEKPSRDPTEGVDLGNGVALEDLDGYEGDWEPDTNPTTTRKLRKVNDAGPKSLEDVIGMKSNDVKETKIMDPLLQPGDVPTSKDNSANQQSADIEMFVQKVMRRTKRVMSFQDYLAEDARTNMRSYEDISQEDKENQIPTADMSVEVRSVRTEFFIAPPSPSEVNDRTSVDPFWGRKAEIIKSSVVESEYIEMSDFSRRKDGEIQEPTSKDTQGIQDAAKEPENGWSSGKISEYSPNIEFIPIYPPGPLVLEHPLIMENWTNIAGCPCRLAFDYRINSIVYGIYGNRSSSGSSRAQQALRIEPDTSSEELDQARFNEEAFFRLMDEDTEIPTIQSSSIQTEPIEEESSQIDQAIQTSELAPETSDSETEENEEQVEDVENADETRRAFQELKEALDEFIEMSSRARSFSEPALVEYRTPIVIDGSSPENSNNDEQSSSGSSSEHYIQFEGEPAEAGSERNSEESENDSYEMVDPTIRYLPERRQRRQYIYDPVNLYIPGMNYTLEELLPALVPSSRNQVENVASSPEQEESEEAEEELEAVRIENENNDEEASEYTPMNTDDENEEATENQVRYRMTTFTTWEGTTPAFEEEEDFRFPEPLLRAENHEENMRKIEQENAGVLKQWAENGVDLNEKFICKVCHADQMHYVCDTCQQAMCISCEAKLHKHSHESVPRCPFCREAPSKGEFIIVRLPRI